MKVFETSELAMETREDVNDNDGFNKKTFEEKWR